MRTSFAADLKSQIENEYAAKGYKLGYRLLYSPENVLQGARVAFLGLNPGGRERPTNHAEFAMEHGSAYVQEDWGSGPGKGKLQRQVQTLFEKISEPPEGVLAGNLVPFRSPSWDSFPNRQEALKFGKLIWKEIFAHAKPNLFIGMGRQAIDALKEMLGVTAAESIPIGWGNLCGERGEFAGGCLIGVPHLSRYPVMTRAESQPGLTRLLSGAVGLVPLAPINEHETAAEHTLAMGLNQQINVCIFDVNGVLIDSNLANAKAMAQAFTDDPALQNRIADFYLTLTGIDRGTKIRNIQQKVIARPFKDREFELRWERFKAIGSECMRRASLIPDCKEVLIELGRRQVTRVALSNTPEPELRTILISHGLESMLDVIRGGGDWPKSESLAQLLRECGLKPDQCLFFGDGKGDLMSAKYVGVAFVAIDPGTDEFDGQDGFWGPYRDLADWGIKVLRMQIPGR
jgi:phosphoglycolate phosphatase-like HAD superfamily hydrolase